jgi:hypothetical protein
MECPAPPGYCPNLKDMKRSVFRIAAATIIITLAVAGGIRIERARLNKLRYLETRARIVELQEALRRYHADNGYYPPTDPGLLALDDYFSRRGWTWSADPQIVFPRRSPSASSPLLDAWGDPYRYESDGNTYMLWSLGPHGYHDPVCARSPKPSN